MSRLSSITARLAAAALTAAAAWAIAPASPAAAGTCASGDGVSVVVDFHGLGGGVQAGCLADGGGRAAKDLFAAAGFSLDYVQRQPGFVCRVGGKPADDPCVNTPPTNAYWALWWSDGASGSWTYSTTGVGGLTVPDGGYVALSWNGSATRAQPGITPAPHPAPTQSTPSTSPKPTKPTRPTKGTQPSQTTTTDGPAESGSPVVDGSAGTSPSAGESASGKVNGKKGEGKKGKKGERSPGADASASSEETATAAESTHADDVATSAEAVEPANDGLPGWVAPAVIAVLFAAGGAAAVVRRRSGP